MLSLKKRKFLEVIRYYSDKQNLELSKNNLKASTILFILALIYASFSTFFITLNPDKVLFRRGMDSNLYNALLSISAITGVVWCYILIRWKKIEDFSVRTKIRLYNSSIYYNMFFYTAFMNLYFMSIENKMKPLMGFGIIIGIYTLTAKVSPYILSTIYITAYALGYPVVRKSLGQGELTLSFVYTVMYCIIVFIRAKKDKMTFENEERLNQINIEAYQKYFDQIEINSGLQKNIIIKLADLIESRDEVTGEHTRKTSDIVEIIAKQLLKENKFNTVLTPDYIKNLKFLSMLHDVGKIKIPDFILNKPSALTPEEFSIMKMHTIYGSNIINEVFTDCIEDKQKVRMAEEIAYYHHEWWNGNGYPAGLKRNEIPLHARIMAVADVYDALTSSRCYKPAFSYDKAFEIIQKESGTHFDPDVVTAFVNAKTEILRRR